MEGFKGQYVACRFGNNRQGERILGCREKREMEGWMGEASTYAKLHSHKERAVAYSIFTAEWEAPHLTPFTLLR